MPLTRIVLMPKVVVPQQTHHYRIASHLVCPVMRSLSVASSCSSAGWWGAVPCLRCFLARARDVQQLRSRVRVQELRHHLEALAPRHRGAEAPGRARQRRSEERSTASEGLEKGQAG
jgi:hypothetical protein